MKKIYKLSSIIFSFLPIIGIISCSSKKEIVENNNNWWDENITIQVNPGWAWDVKGNAFPNAAKLVEKKINELKNDDNYDKYSFKNLPNVNVKFDWSTSDNETIIQNILNKKHDLGFASISATMKVDQSKIQPLIQTKTNSFKFDPEWKVYKDSGTNKDEDLKAIALAQTNLFSSQYNQNNLSWNGAIYKNFYNTNKKVDFYRGNIWVYGSKKTQAKNAWANKNWVNFRDAGILHGDPSSGGRFKLQEKLLKKHFGSDAFTTLQEEIQNHSSKFKKAYASTMLDGNYSIAFDDEGSFGWTKRVQDQTTHFNATNPEILVVTEPLKYDVGSFRENMDPRQAKLIANAFIKLIEEAEAKSESDKTKALSEIYGPNYGYNDYALIENRKTELEDTWISVMGSDDKTW